MDNDDEYEYEYIDLQDTIQGPYPRSFLQLWYEQGYFPKETKVRKVKPEREEEYITIAQLLNIIDETKEILIEPINETILLPVELERVANANTHFQVLNLPLPTKDNVGNPIWGISSADIRTAYKRVSLQVHPDKHVGIPIARDVFSKVKEAYKILLDQDTCLHYVREYIAQQVKKEDDIDINSLIDCNDLDKLSEYRERLKIKKINEVKVYETKISNKLKDKLIKAKLISKQIKEKKKQSINIVDKESESESESSSEEEILEQKMKNKFKRHKLAGF